MSEFKVEFYVTESGKIPVKEFISSLSPKEAVKVEKAIFLLSENGYRLREPFSKYLRDDIFELRVKFNGNTIRILYFFFYGKIIILTNGFMKKTSKTPVKEIEKAIKRKEDFINRRAKND